MKYLQPLLEKQHFHKSDFLFQLETYLTGPKSAENKKIKKFNKNKIKILLL